MLLRVKNSVSPLALNKLPKIFLDSLEGLPGFDRNAFEAVHEAAASLTSIRINEAKWHIPPGVEKNSKLLLAEPVPWCRKGYYLKSRPSFTFDPLFHAGCYYVQEASSMFLEQAFRQLTPDEPIKVLDLAAAPGGKSTHILSLLPARSLLVSNEVIRSRAHVLTDNIIKWGRNQCIVTSNDPTAFKNLSGYFDVMVVDAPCSGSGLFRRDEAAIAEWSLHTVQLCAQRQQRILADALPALKENGLLVYSTCSYSAAEDEAMADWLVREMQLESISIRTEGVWAIVKSFSPQTQSAGYRFYPDKVKGEGFYMACFRKKAATPQQKIRAARLEKLSAKDQSYLQPWLKQDEECEYVKLNDYISALPVWLVDDFSFLQSKLHVLYAGVRLGQLMKNKLVPDHALALSRIIADDVAFLELDEEQAIRYLQKQELQVTASQTGWQLVRFGGHNLGWINALKNRINNYYPKEIRILKQHNDHALDK